MKTLLLLPLLALASCGQLKKDVEEDDKKAKITGPERRIIGRIASVSHAGEFVLIQKFGPGVLPKNTIYQSQGPGGRSASLKPSGERVRDFYAADLVSGNVTKGDAVIGYPDLKKDTDTDPNTLEKSTQEVKSPPLKEEKSLLLKNVKAPQTIGVPD